ncbi:Asp-tRNA(Asn)/Glu-tRNA(Gln) amidotransferase subunit GatC [Acidobacteria bacterium AH-259-D05]|nr:Asp-tRNA(Asn)/Glu-tRNA(Gln) amidotransferase subunit GatC [Acidobacteria bacterium AH-259-D05]
MAISTKEVEKIADLSHLEFTAEELQRFVDQFQKILEYFARLEALSVDKVEPTYHALEEENLATPTREDEVKPSLPAGRALANAPDSCEDFFRVPAVIE